MKKLLGIVAAFAVSCLSRNFLTENLQTKNNSQINETFLIQEKVNAKVDYGNLIEKPIKQVEENFYTDKSGIDDDNRYGATEINAERSTIVAKICKHNWFETWVKGIGWIDVDFYTFSIRETYTYHFTFMAPNRGYYFTLFKYGDIANDKNLVEKFTLNGNDNKDVKLNPGTYYIKISTETESDIDNNTAYTLRVSRSSNSNSQSAFLLNETNKSNYKMVLWENDLVPDNVNRWDPHDQLMYQREVYNAKGVAPKDTGFVDPVYTQEGKYLDSVLYIWDKQIIEKIGILLEYTHNAISSMLEANEADRVYKVDTSYNPWQGFAIDIASLFDEAGISTYLSLAQDCAEIVVFVNNLLYDNVEDMVDLTKYNYGLGGFIVGIRAACDDLTKPNADPNEILCIPRYAHLKKTEEKIDLYSTDHNTFWSPTYDAADTAYTRLYRYKADRINVRQSINLLGIHEYHGKWTAFRNYDEIKNYTGLDYKNLISTYDPTFGEYNVVSANQVIFEKKLHFNSANNHSQIHSVFYEEDETVQFFTRGELDTVIKLFDDNMNLLVSNDNGGYDCNACIKYSLEAMKRYTIIVNMKTHNPNAEGWAMLDGISAMTITNDLVPNEPSTFDDIGEFVGTPFEFFLDTYVGKATVVKFVPEIPGAYYFSAFYRNNYHFFALSLTGTSTWNYDYAYGSGVLDMDWVDLWDGTPRLLVLVRDNKNEAIPSNARGFGLMADLRCCGDI